MVPRAPTGSGRARAAPEAWDRRTPSPGDAERGARAARRARVGARCWSPARWSTSAAAVSSAVHLRTSRITSERAAARGRCRIAVSSASSTVSLAITTASGWCSHGAAGSRRARRRGGDRRVGAWRAGRSRRWWRSGAAMPAVDVPSSTSAASAMRAGSVSCTRVLGLGRAIRAAADAVAVELGAVAALRRRCECRWVGRHAGDAGDRAPERERPIGIAVVRDRHHRCGMPGAYSAA